MKDTVRRLLGKVRTPSTRDQCVFCREMHSAIDLKGRGRDTWPCRKCNRINVTVDYRGLHFTRAATRIERAERRIRDHYRVVNLFDPKELPCPSPLHLESLTGDNVPKSLRRLSESLVRSSREDLLARIKKLQKDYKSRGLGIVVSWDFEPMTWAAMVSFHPKDIQNPGRATIQFYGAPTAEHLVAGIEKSFNEEKILDLDDSRYSWSVASEVVAHLLKKQVPCPTLSS